jgi:hypothetical protein
MNKEVFLENQARINQSGLMLIGYFDELIQQTSNELRRIREEGYILFLKGGYRLYLKEKNCGLPGCEICPHNLVWKLGKQVELKDGGEKIIWKNREYLIDKISWSRVKRLSERDREKYSRVKKQVKEVLRKRERIKRLKMEFVRKINQTDKILNEIGSYLF